MRHPLVLVVPCYNEERRLPTEDFRRFLPANPDVKVVFVDDGSGDGTLPLLRRIREELPDQVSVVHLEENVGKAEAVRRGVLHALEESVEYVGYWDADLSTPLHVVRGFAEILDLQPEVEAVLGSRVRLLGRTIVRSARRHYLGRVFATAVSLILRLPVYDTQCGAKLFRATEACADVFSEPFLSRWIFDVEILARFAVHAHRSRNLPLERRVIEYPLPEWTDRPGSRLKARDFGLAVWELGRIARVYHRRIR